MSQVLDDWISHHEAAELMHVHEIQLRRKDAQGQWAKFTELARIQHVKGGPILMLRSQVIGWKERVEREAREAAEARCKALLPRPTGVNTWASIAPEIARSGGVKLAKKLMGK